MEVVGFGMDIYISVACSHLYYECEYIYNTTMEIIIYVNQEDSRRDHSKSLTRTNLSTIHSEWTSCF
jgi:hypothetical protein